MKLRKIDGIISRGWLAASWKIGPADCAANFDSLLCKLWRVSDAFCIVGVVWVVGIAFDHILRLIGFYFFVWRLFWWIWEWFEVVEKEVELVPFGCPGDDLCWWVVDFPLDGCLSGERDTFLTDILSTKMERRRLYRRGKEMLDSFLFLI